MAAVYTSTADLLQFGDGTIDDIDVNTILESAPVVRALFAKEASHDVVHKYLRKTTAPSVGFRSPNAGRENQKATYTEVTADLKLLDATFSIDQGIVNETRDGEALFRREAEDHLRAAFFKLEVQLINGADAAGFDGLLDLAAYNALSDTQVVDATGTSAGAATSVWMIRSGDANMALAYGNGAQISVGTRFKSMVTTALGAEFAAETLPLMAWATLQVGQDRDAVRICNITAESGKGLTDDLLSQAYEKFPIDAPPTHILMNRASRGQLQRSRSASNPIGTPAQLPDNYEGIPIIATDAITSLETIVS